jgi:Ca2+-binding EF-hand superfamily protein
MRTQLLVAAVLLALPGIAQGQAVRRGMDTRFQAMDTNGDRVITREEWRGSNQSFRVHDWNGDGVLSGDEVRTGARRGDPGTDFDSNVPFDNWTPRGFATLDRNRDGRITRDEWYFDREGFLRADNNRDNVLSRSEFLGEGIEDDRDDRFDYLDVDNNGRIERDEWHSSADAFAWLDRNRDGVLSRDEVVGSEAANLPADVFASLDVNRNGEISINEWHWSRTSFVSRDSNGDGMLSRREFAAGGPVGAVGTSGIGARTVTVPATERWTDSGITVQRGSVVQINASGVVSLSDNPSDTAGPEGSRIGRRANEAPLPQQPAGGLIVRFGDSAPIYVGATSQTLEAPAGGRIYFSVNDDHLGDNRGQFRVTTRIER